MMVGWIEVEVFGGCALAETSRGALLLLVVRSIAKVLVVVRWYLEGARAEDGLRNPIEVGFDALRFCDKVNIK
jgi:hypothetical protein